jgi:hypothetical protein
VKYDRTVIAYHGCDAAVARGILNKKAQFQKSQNEYDWLGEGIYFWEFGAARALNFAKFQQTRSKVKTPDVIGAIVQLGKCFDLTDTTFTDELGDAYNLFERMMSSQGLAMPMNSGTAPDKKLRKLDCAVLNFYLRSLSEQGSNFDTVRCAFEEGPPAFPGSNIRRETHIQIAVRNPDCIVGVFRP